MSTLGSYCAHLMYPKFISYEVIDREFFEQIVKLPSLFGSFLCLRCSNILKEGYTKLENPFINIADEVPKRSVSEAEEREVLHESHCSKFSHEAQNF